MTLLALAAPAPEETLRTLLESHFSSSLGCVSFSSECRKSRSTPSSSAVWKELILRHNLVLTHAAHTTKPSES